ncbi:MAG: hypothetical protein GY950_12600 [bacterium]|nr:hypothetical protein [bacterium]
MKEVRSVFSFVFAVVSLLLVAGDNLTTDVDKTWAKKLEEMRKEIRAKGYTFTVDYTDACEYTLDQLGGFDPELANADTKSLGTPATPKFKTPSWGLPTRYIGYYTPPRNQGGCGSCWAFCMASAVEGQYMMATGYETNLSEQWLLDCNPWGWDCIGGFIDFSMFVTQGSPEESCYPYVAYQHACWTTCPQNYFIMDWDWVYIPGYVASTADIKAAIVEYGSVAVGIRATPYLQAYSGGVFNRCESGAPNHCVQLCGWDDTLGGGVWLLKNSWGTNWGGVDIDLSGTVDPDERGFAWIVYGCNQVGHSAAYPIPYYGG